jgi:hypothetical protein
VGAPDGFNFHPLGLSIWHGLQSGGDRLFAANWGKSRNTVEVFDLVVEDAVPVAKWVRTVEPRDGKGFMSANSLVATVSLLMLSVRLPPAVN